MFAPIPIKKRIHAFVFRLIKSLTITLLSYRLIPGWLATWIIDKEGIRDE